MLKNKRAEPNTAISCTSPAIQDASTLRGIKKHTVLFYCVLCVYSVLLFAGVQYLSEWGNIRFSSTKSHLRKTGYKSAKSLEKSRLFGAISFSSPFDGAGDRS